MEYFIKIRHSNLSQGEISFMDKERKEKTVRPQDAEADGIIEGRNAVIEALRAGASIDKIFIQ